MFKTLNQKQPSHQQKKPWLPGLALVAHQRWAWLGLGCTGPWLASAFFWSTSRVTFGQVERCCTLSKGVVYSEHCPPRRSLLGSSSGTLTSQWGWSPLLWCWHWESQAWSQTWLLSIERAKFQWIDIQNELSMITSDSITELQWITLYAIFACC